MLGTIEPQLGANQNISAGDHTNLHTRTAAAREAGMSKHQQVTAMKIARTPKEKFNELIEG